MRRKAEVVILMGLQASGKSTFYAERFSRTHLRTNLDMLRTRKREQVIVQACLEAKQSFVVDNTNPTEADRACYLDLARVHGFRAIGYWFLSSLEDALQRNRARGEDERVPDVAVSGTHAKFEMPTVDEGFDELYAVTLNDGAGFSVKQRSGDL